MDSDRIQWQLLHGRIYRSGYEPKNKISWWKCVTNDQEYFKLEPFQWIFAALTKNKAGKSQHWINQIKKVYEKKVEEEEKEYRQKVRKRKAEKERKAEEKKKRNKLNYSLVLDSLLALCDTNNFTIDISDRYRTLHSLFTTTQNPTPAPEPIQPPPPISQISPTQPPPTHTPIAHRTRNRIRNRNHPQSQLPPRTIEPTTPNATPIAWKTRSRMATRRARTQN